MKEQLPAFVLAELFTDSLVSIGDELKPGPAKESTLKPKNQYLGNYEKKIIVLVNDKDNPYLSDDNLDFLTGILSACKLNLAQVALINFNNAKINFQQLKNEMQPGYLLSFGIKALQIELPFSMPDYQVQQYSNCTILTAPSLSELNQPTPEAKTEKAKLWQSLKKMLAL